MYTPVPAAAVLTASLLLTARSCPQVTTGPYQLALAGGGGALQASALQNMLADIQQAAESHTQAQMRWAAGARRVSVACGQLERHFACASYITASWPQYTSSGKPCCCIVSHARRRHSPATQCSVRRRQGGGSEGPSSLLFRVGQVMRHKRYHYRCAVLA